MPSKSRKAFGIVTIIKGSEIETWAEGDVENFNIFLWDTVFFGHSCLLF
jgi:hypothetical protein